MRVFQFSDYRSFIRSRVQHSPKKGHGQYRKMAEHLEIPASLLSQIMSGRRELSSELASLLCEYFGLSDAESDYFLSLVEWERAGNPSLKRRLEKRLKALQTKGLEVEKQLKFDRKLSEAEMMHFYSRWDYSAVRLMTSIDGKDTVEAIAQALRLPLPQVAQTLEFLVSVGLCTTARGRYKIGPKSTHVGNETQAVIRHHMNWRLKVLSQMTTPQDHELLFTGPVTLSKEACMEVKKKLLQLIDDWGQIVDSAKEERLAVLNIDWIGVGS